MEYFISTFLAEAGFLSHITDFGIAYQDTAQEQLSLNLSPSTVLLTDRTSVDSLCYFVVVPTESAQ